jgi:hypothetical protein
MTNKGYFVFSVMFAALCSSSLNAQTLATTDDGRKVILNDDGTWTVAALDDSLMATSTKSVEIFSGYIKALYNSDVADDVKICIVDTISKNSGNSFSKITFPVNADWNLFAKWINDTSLVNGKITLGQIAQNDGLTYMTAVNQIALSCGMKP